MKKKCLMLKFNRRSIYYAICLLTFGFQMPFRKTAWEQRGLGTRE